MPAQWEVAIDIGGTFTDVFLVDRSSGRHLIEKGLTHAQPAQGVMNALQAALDRAALEAGDLGTIAHATTLMTNAVITRGGARVALLITEGFIDTLLIGREHRYNMYDVRLRKVEPLVRRRDTYGIAERVLADGTVLHPLGEAQVQSVAADLRERGIDDIAVCLLHSYRFPQHERRVREILLDCDPALRVTLSHEVVAELREYERASTAVANAYVLPLAERYLGQLEDELGEAGHRGAFFVMLSSGGLATTETARRFPVRLIESGPAAGALAAAETGKRSGRTELLSFDMGGTTAKACIIQDGVPIIAGQLEVARLERFHKGSGLPLNVPSVDLIEIGAGGGSIARLDRFGLFQVGPDSAGSDPGPVCYGLGGAMPTVTDANLVLGYLDPDYFLGGRMSLDAEAAREAVWRQLAEPLSLSVMDAAWAVHELVNESMANAARTHALERGVDLATMPMFAFGGAGPAHAWRVARNLGMRTVIVPPGAGIGSAVGLLSAPQAFDMVRSAPCRLEAVDWNEVLAMLGLMEREGRDLLERSGLDVADATTRFAVDMRLAGQAFEVTVPLGEDRPRANDEDRLLEAFASTYRERFSRPPPRVAAEIVSWRVRTSGPLPAYPFAADERPGASSRAQATVKGWRDAYFPAQSEPRPTPVFDRYDLVAGMRIAGPAIIEERESTVVLGEGGVATIDVDRNLILEAE